MPTTSSRSPRAVDSAVIDACRAGDREALGRVFGQHAAQLSRLIYRVIGRREDIEDVLQATFVEAMRAFASFRGDSSVATWLSRIAVHVAYGHLRRPHVRRAKLAVVADPDHPDDRGAPPTTVAAARRDLERVFDHLSHLRPKQRLAFSLHVLDGRPIEEVAALTGATVSATRSRVLWARRRLKQRLARDPFARHLVAEADK